MNLEIAKNRIDSVIRPDATTESFNDFIITHVPLKKLQLLDKYEISPASKQYYTEEEIFKNIIMNDGNNHQLVVVYGQSGTGKSHLIRFLQTKLERENKLDEVVLFIRRSDNTLKGTIQQLLKKPEVQNIQNRDVYERLVKASATVSENVLKDNIYHKFIIAISNDEGENAIKLNSIRRKQLVQFFNNENIHDLLMSPDGPIERIYSKVAQSKVLVDRDVIAEFKTEDFEFDSDLIEVLESDGADSKAVKMAKLLLADDNIETIETITNYLNQFVSQVIQECAGIESGDFKQVFTDIRKELYRQGKNLTLFIEDITSFSGVDSALLNALMEEHTGDYSGICRISSIIGTTINYFEKNFNDNHKDRITKFIYIPDDSFDRIGRYEFVAKYINAMSLMENEIDTWVDSGAEMVDYPVHTVAEGQYWDFIDIGHGKKLPLYPFTKHAVDYLFNNQLTKGNQTVRYLLRDIVEPVIRDIIDAKNTFPKDRFKNVTSIDLNLRQKVTIQVESGEIERMLRLLSIWGDQTGKETKKGSARYICGLHEQVFKELNLPVITLDYIESIDNQEKSEEETEVVEKEIEVDNSKNETVNNVTKVLADWVSGVAIGASASVGIEGYLYSARQDLSKYVETAINWQAEGVSVDLLKKTWNERSIVFDGQIRGTGLYKLPRNWDSVYVVLAFVKWRAYGKTWNYPDSFKDTLEVTKWLSAKRDSIIKVVKEYKEGIETNYIEPSIAIEMYRTVINGDYTNRTLNNYSQENLFGKLEKNEQKNKHSKEWNKLKDFIFDKSSENKDTLTNFFNITQGNTKGSVVVLNSLDLDKKFRKVKKLKANLAIDSLQLDDRNSKRKQPYEVYKTINERLESVINAEQEIAKNVLTFIEERLDITDIEEEINALIDAVDDYFSKANKAQINVTVISYDTVKKNKSKIRKALETLNTIDFSADYMDQLLAFASDPISDLEPLIELLKQLDKVTLNGENKINNKMAIINSSSVETQIEQRINGQKKILEECLSLYTEFTGGGIDL